MCSWCSSLTNTAADAKNTSLLTLSIVLCQRVEACTNTKNSGEYATRAVCTTGRFSRGPHEACIHDAVFSPCVWTNCSKERRGGLSKGWCRGGVLSAGRCQRVLEHYSHSFNACNLPPTSQHSRFNIVHLNHLSLYHCCQALLTYINVLFLL
jgi:hypothetical protein